VFDNGETATKVRKFGRDFGARRSNCFDLAHAADCSGGRTNRKSGADK
jgi:hypothetical protein